jgi:hypothetical protein
VGKIIFIFILLSYYGIKNIQAEAAPVFSVEQNVSLNEFLSGHAGNLFTIDTGHPDDHPYSKKEKKRKKGIKPALICFADEHHWEIPGFDIELIYSSETFYLFCLYSGDDERGPPVVKLVS